MKELPVQPFRAPARGAARVPGSKSISNRALLLAFLCDGEVRIGNLLDSEDTRALREAFASLGVPLREEDGLLRVSGRGGRPGRTEAVFNVRNAGTVARFLPAILSLAGEGRFLFDGSAAMRRRPMAGLIDSLRSLGAAIRCTGEEGHFPFEMVPGGWRTDGLQVDASRSSQILSGLLLAATRAGGETRFGLRGGTVSRPFLGMTLRMIAAFGGDAREEGGAFRVRPGLGGPPDGIYRVEPDATAASYFLALPLAAKGACRVEGIPEDSLQGDVAFLDVLGQAGLEAGRDGPGITASYPAGGLAADLSHGAPFLDVDFNAFSDTFLTLAALAPLLPGPLRIRGIAHTRHQETDRVGAMAAELRKLGQAVEEEEDALLITPCPAEARRLSAAAPLPVDTYEDHRVAMSFGILGSHDLHGDGRPWIAIRDPDCCGKTFPGFFEELARLRKIADSA